MVVARQCCQVCQVTFVAVMVAVRFFAWTYTWCRRHNRARLPRLVVPPWSQCHT